MKKIFPDPILNLPLADLPFKNAKGYTSQAKNHQIVFMQFDKDTILPEHSHKEQWSIVLDGKIELTIANSKKLFSKGDMYLIPAGVVHFGKIYAGYKDITFFNEKHRYNIKQ